MTDDNVKTIRATFATREAADRAVEHLVQQHGIARADVFVRASDMKNSAGTSPSGGDVAQGEASRPDAPLHGEIEVSADVTIEEAAKAEQAFRDAGAADIEVR
ncbi:MAG: hypothetical protein ACOYJQ_12420 [Pseudochelatococcus sp.]|uniref:hypothetical protein n=1 Tax=Pseudochelatococcus sp. TaxID=2020869 RepID=UPI003D91406C